MLAWKIFYRINKSFLKARYASINDGLQGVFDVEKG